MHEALRRQIILLPAACALAGCATLRQPDSRLVLWNRLGTAQEVACSAVGPGGTLHAGRFVAGRFGQGIELDMREEWGVTFPASIVPNPRGCIEFWARLEGFPARLPVGGQPSLVAASPTASADGAYPKTDFRDRERE